MSFALISKVSHDTSFPFLRYGKLCLAVSAFLVVASIGLLLTRGLNYGVDFRGGIQIATRYEQTVDMEALRAHLNQDDSLGEVRIQGFDQPNEVSVMVQYQEAETSDEAERVQQVAVKKVKALLEDEGALGNKVNEHLLTEVVGPTVSGELIRAGIYATVLALLAIALYIYISFKFEWRFSLAALMALAHDVVTTIGLFSLLQLEFNLSTVAAVLTIAGYSINDTVVIFDRVREILRKYQFKTVEELLDMALNKTLTRTLMTSVTTLLAVLALVIFGGPVIAGLAIALIWGVIVGTYSSLFVATPLLNLFGLSPSVFEKKEETGEAFDSAAAFVKNLEKRGKAKEKTEKV